MVNMFYVFRLFILLFMNVSILEICGLQYACASVIFDNQWILLQYFWWQYSNRVVVILSMKSRANIPPYTPYNFHTQAYKGIINNHTYIMTRDIIVSVIKIGIVIIPIDFSISGCVRSFVFVILLIACS